MVGYYAYFELNNGFRKVLYWSKDKMLAHADRYSQAFHLEAREAQDPRYSRVSYADFVAGNYPKGDEWKYSSFWYCDECEYVRVVDNTVFCGLSGKLLHPMMFLRGQGFGPAAAAQTEGGTRDGTEPPADLQRMGPEAQRQVMEKLGIVGKTKAPKYHNQPDSRGNLRFDSKKEARRYDELMLMLKAGQIRNLRLQQQYTLQESYITETGERVRAIHYVADFAYERPTAPDKYGTVFWLPVVEDVKSRATKTAQYEMKKKLLRERFNLTITEV